MSSLKLLRISLFALAAVLLVTLAVFVRRPVAQALFQKGDEAAAAWKNDDALSYYTWASRIHNLEGEAELSRAHILFQKGEIRQSFESYSDIEAKTDSRNKARAQNGLGICLFNMSRPDEAIVNHKKALAYARRTGDVKLEAESLVELSRVLYHAKGQFDEAGEFLEKALKIGRETNDERIIANALRNIGVVLWWGKGERERPLAEYYLPALAIYRNLKDKKSEATMLSNIGHIHSFQSDSYEFMNFQQQSFQIREDIGDLAGLSESYTALGSAYLAVRNLRKASEYFEKSIALSKRTGFTLTRNEAETHLAAVYSETGRFDEAISILEELYKREIDSPGQAATRLGAIGTCYLTKGDFRKARETFEKVLALDSTNISDDPQGKFAAYVFLGEAYLRVGELEKASGALNAATDVRSNNRLLIQGQFTYSITYAEFEVRKGNPGAAIAHLREAVDHELNLFAAGGTNQITIPMPRDYERLFTLLIERLPPLLGDSKQTNELVFRFLEQRRYRTFRNFLVASVNSKPNPEMSDSESLAYRQIQNLAAAEETPDNIRRLKSAYSEYENAVVRSNFSGSVRDAILVSKPVEVVKAQRSLNDKTAMVEYLIAGQRIYALVIRNSSFHILKLPVSTSNLRNKAGLLRAALSTPSAITADEDWKPIARSLFSGLIQPLKESGGLAGIDRLVIVRSGALYDLPFATLMSEDRFLIEDYALVFPPSATFYAEAKAKTPNTGFVSFGRNSNGRYGLKPLKYAESEAHSVAYVSGGIYFTGEDASETRVKEYAPKSGILHISAHATANSEMPLLSRLILGPSNADDGDLTIREILDLNLGAELVTIAACEGAKSFSPDPFMSTDTDRSGLSESFLHAGAGNVLASLAPASDQATFALMKDFYSRLNKADKATALAEAQRSLLQGKETKEFSHPRYWSNFVLIGKGI